MISTLAFAALHRPPAETLGMHGHDAVGLLARRAAPLPLHARSFFALLRTTCFVNNADAVGSGVLRGDQLLQFRLHQTMIPIEQAQELLQGARRYATSRTWPEDLGPEQIRESGDYALRLWRLPESV